MNWKNKAVLFIAFLMLAIALINTGGTPTDFPQEESFGKMDQESWSIFQIVSFSLIALFLILVVIIKRSIKTDQARWKTWSKEYRELNGIPEEEYLGENYEILESKPKTHGKQYHLD